ncbi:MAG: secondary thiamine-phosphate synthase enzyme YjbQ [Chromatiaceae bacterium]|jgi:secondary thiamine-phosphate synthase enzyme|nr:secondary thiamine-phosphate synthase enzyme YjbQ [Chromatiaceae bacterium]
MTHQETIRQRTHGRGTYDITDRLRAVVRNAGIQTGLCHLFLQHTSASLIICENADPTVRTDLERFIARLVPDGDPIYQHTLEGPDDMPAHVRSILTTTDLTLPISDGQCALGTWQGVYLYEHRHHQHERRVIVTVRD